MDGTQMSKDLGDLENMLASLTAAEAAETAAESAVIEDEELDEALLADLDATIARAESYEAQDATADMSATGAPAPTAGKTKRATNKTSKASSTGSTARAPRKSLADLDNAVFEITTGSPNDKNNIIAKRPKQVKIAEKFDNLFQAIATSKLPSSYVVTAIKLLVSKTTMTSADLIAAYKADGLGDGTARSQTGQIMELFSVVGIANRSGQALTLRPDSAIVKKVNAMIVANAQPVAV